MVSRTWLGGGNNRAGNPHDWAPTGPPQPGDTLQILRRYAPYVMNIRGDDLAGDPLFVSYANVTFNMSNHAVATVSGVGGIAGNYPIQRETFNLSQGSSLSLGEITAGVTVNISGEATFIDNPGIGTGTYSAVTVNLAPYATWHGHFDLTSHYSPKTLTINGGEQSTFSNDGTSIQSFHDVVIPVPVIGTGSFGVVDAKLEFISSVGPNQTVSVAMGPYATGLQIDQPTQFAASVDLSVNGDVMAPVDSIDLMGLATADSYTYQNDMLSIYGANQVIDRLRLTDSTPFGFEVEKTAGSVNIVPYADSSHTNVGTPLPIHVGS